MTTTRSHPAPVDGRTPVVPAILVLGTAEWNSEIATNQHYVVRELAQIAPTYFVESLGLRRVRLDVRDVTRMAGRVGRAALGRGVDSYRAIPDGARVVSPMIVPIHRAPTHLPNRLLLERAVRDWRTSPPPRLLWTFTPVTYQLERYADFVLYHCVDILKAFPGIDQVAVSAGERHLAGQTQLAIATSDGVAEHLRTVGLTAIRTLPNVADVDIFSAASKPASERKAAALFAGNLSPHKLDFPLLRSLAAALRGRGELLLAGPVAAGGGGFESELAELLELGARYLGVLTLEQLAEVAGGCTVGVIPYALNDYTAGVSPLKCYEYLAAGLDVVSTAIPDVVRAARYTEFITVETAAQQFVGRVVQAVEHRSDQAIKARSEYAQAFGWRSRGELLRSIVAGAVASHRPTS